MMKPKATSMSRALRRCSIVAWCSMGGIHRSVRPPRLSAMGCAAILAPSMCRWRCMFKPGRFLSGIGNGGSDGRNWFNCASRDVYCGGSDLFSTRDCRHFTKAPKRHSDMRAGSSVGLDTIGVGDCTCVGIYDASAGGRETSAPPGSTVSFSSEKLPILCRAHTGCGCEMQALWVRSCGNYRRAACLAWLVLSNGVQQRN